MTEQHQMPHPSRGLRRRIAPATVALAALAALTLTACSGSDDTASAKGDGSPVGATSSAPASTGTTGTTGTSGSPAPASTTPTPSKTRPKPATSPVHISLLNNDGGTYGIGMPVIAYFSRMITDAAPLQQATTVTVDGKPAQGAWYFENSRAGSGPLEAHFRLKGYWPAHARIRVDIPAKGISAGKGLAYDDTLFSEFKTGAANIGVVSDARHSITVTSDGKKFGTFPVSLGASGSDTLHGTKVVMEQDQDTRMQGDSLSGHYDDAHVYWTQRLTYSGEYLHAAPWNSPSETPDGSGNIGSSNSSNGCTNLSTSDAEKLYKLMRVGDVVRYPDADGSKMQLGEGYGDWNVNWSEWRTGGLVSTV